MCGTLGYHLTQILQLKSRKRFISPPISPPGSATALSINTCTSYSCSWCGHSLLELQLPYRISLISRGLTWLEIQWSVKGGKTPNNYTVCFQPKHGTTEQTVTLCPTVSHNVKSAKLTGLTPCTLYAINVTAVSSSHFKTSQIKEFQTEKGTYALYFHHACSSTLTIIVISTCSSTNSIDQPSMQ